MENKLYKIELREFKTNGISNDIFQGSVNLKRFKEFLGDLAISYDRMEYCIEYYKFTRMTQVANGDYLQEKAILYIDL